MAAKNAKPAKSSESGTEWTFIDTYDGTIETRKDCVTYRKPTYSEILKGVTEEELAEVESEPEFEVLASFQFRSKGESFGIGSSAPKLQESSEQLGKASKSESKDDKSDGCSSSDDSIMIISSHYKPEKPVCSEENKNNVSSETVANSDECDDECDDDDDDDGLTIKAAKAKSESSGTDDAIVVVDEGCMYDDELDDDDDDEMIDLGDSEVKDEWTKADDVDDANDCSTGSSKADDVQCTPFMDTSLNRIFLDESVDDTAEPDVKPADSTSNDKRLLSIDPLDSSKELAWDSLTFDLMDALPIMMVSTTSVDDSQSIVFQGQDSDASDCELSSDNSFVPISKSDSQDDTSSFDRLSEFSDDCSDFDEMSPMIPEWFLDPNFTIIGLDDSGHDNSYKDLEIDNEDICDPLIPTWFYDPEHNICDLDETFDESDWSDCSDSDSEYMDDSDDADSVVAIPEWLFGDKDNNREHKDNEDSFLFSHLFVDVPTFIILLFLTTALGFSIGHGLTVYLSGQALDRNTKLQGSTDQAKLFPSFLDQRILTAEEIAKLDLLKLEEEIYRQKETELLSSHLRYDLKNLHKNLQEKHSRLLRNYKSTEDRLHVSKSMLWFWRLKYDQEKRRKQNSSSITYLQRQLQNVGALYKKEKKVANKWRRFKKARFPLGRRKNESSELNKNDLQNGNIYHAKASLASKYWVQAILSSRGIDWEDFKRRWTKDFKKLKDESCTLNKSSILIQKCPITKHPFGIRRNKRHCKNPHALGTPNATIKRNSKLLPDVDEERSGESVHERVLLPVGPTVVSIVGPPKAVRRQLKFGLIKIKSKPRLKGETARRRREEIRNDRLKKRETRRKALEVAVQVRELKNVLAELRSDRRKAEKEKFQLEASWRKLRRQRKQFEKEKMQHYQSDKKKIKTIKSKLKKTKSRLKTWKNVASQFQKKAANLQRDMKQISRSKERARDIKNIKMDLKIEKRKLRQQRKDLKALKTRLRQEHRNYAREGWKLEKKRKQLEKMQVPQHYSKMSANKCPKQTKQERKTSRLHVIRKARKTRQTSKRKTNRSNKKERWKLKQLKYWETLENTLKEWTQNLNKTVREKAGGKIKKVWKKLQEKFGNLINFGWTKRKKTKPPYQAKKSKKRKKESKSRAALVYEKILSEQLKFDKQKRMKMDDSRKRMKSPIIDTRKNKKEQIKTNPQTVVKQRRRRQRRKYQRELERLQQWALQMNEKKLEHERIYKEDKKKKKTKFAKVWLKTKPDERENVASEENLRSSRELEPDSVEDTSNLTNTLMLLAQPQFSDYPYESPGEEDDDSKERLENAERVVRDITMAQLEHENKKQASTGLSIPLDDEVVLLSTKNTHSEHQSSDQEKDEQMSNKPTPPLLDSTLYNKFPLLGVIESQKGGPMGLSIPPPSLDPLGSQNSVDDPIGQRTKLWYMRQTPQSWIPPPGPLQSDGSWFFQRSADRAEQRLLHGPLNKENANEQNSFRTQFLNSNGKFDKKNGIWVFARASDRAEQRLLYEPQNQQSAKDRLDSQSKKTHTNPRRPKMKNKDGTWVFERANDRAEQRLNHDPWYMRRAEGREEDREQQQDSWFIERGFDRELLREENAYDDDDDHYYDDDDDEDDYASTP